MAINQIKLDNAEEKGSVSAKRVNLLRAKNYRGFGRYSYWK